MCKKYYGLESRRALEEEEEKGPKYEKTQKLSSLNCGRMVMPDT